jgi:hypothetical protein
MMRYLAILVAIVAMLAGSASSAGAQQPGDQPETTNGGGADSTPVEIDLDAVGVNMKRIQRAVSQSPAIRPESGRQVFRVQVFSRKMTIDDILGPNWRRGPTPAGAMTHQEFLNLVTPQDVQGYAAFDNKQALTVAVTSFALQWAIKQAIQKFDSARTEREKAAARKEVDDAMAALRKARLEAGLPDK